MSEFPDVLEPIVAYREWTYTDSGVLLSPMTRDAWPWNRPLVARCAIEPAVVDISAMGSAHTITQEIRRCSHAPSKPGTAGRLDFHTGAGCGVYAYRDVDWVAAAVSTNAPVRSVPGEVLLSGEVYEYTNGWRAQRARPRKLYRVPKQLRCYDDVTLERIAEMYGIEIEDLDVPQFGASAWVAGRGARTNHLHVHLSTVPASLAFAGAQARAAYVEAKVRARALTTARRWETFAAVMVLWCVAWLALALHWDKPMSAVIQACAAAINAWTFVFKRRRRRRLEKGA